MPSCEGAEQAHPCKKEYSVAIERTVSVVDGDRPWALWNTRRATPFVYVAFLRCYCVAEVIVEKRVGEIVIDVKSHSMLVGCCVDGSCVGSSWASSWNLGCCGIDGRAFAGAIELVNNFLVFQFAEYFGQRRDGRTSAVELVNRFLIFQFAEYFGQRRDGRSSPVELVNNFLIFQFERVVGRCKQAGKV